VNRRPCILTSFPVAFMQADPEGPIPYQPLTETERARARAAKQAHQVRHSITPTHHRIPTEEGKPCP